MAGSPAGDADRHGRQPRQRARHRLSRDADHRRVEVNSIYGSSLSAALGNQINVDAAVGSSVVINGNQINKGNQLAVTVIGKDYEDLSKETIDDFQKRR